MKTGSDKALSTMPEAQYMLNERKLMVAIRRVLCDYLYVSYL